MIFALNLAAAFLYAVGAIFMKASDGLRNVPSAVLVYACFGAGATLQAIAMRKVEVGVANTIVLGVEAIAALVLGVLFFRESLSGTKLTAIALVAGGVWLLRQS